MASTSRASCSAWWPCTSTCSSPTPSGSTLDGLASSSRRSKTHMKLAYFDLETTGKEVDKARIVQVAIITSSGGRFSSHVNPAIPIPPEATEIHGITDEMVAEAPTFGVVALKVLAILEGCVLVGYNSHAYDTPVLAHELDRVGLKHDLLERQEIDLFNLWRTQEPRTG